MDADTLRPTFDIDTVVTAHTWDEYRFLRARLEKAGFRTGHGPHEMHFRTVRFDLIPYGPGVIQEGKLEWPGTGLVMSALGLREAFESAKTQRITPSTSVAVASEAAVVLLKIIAYEDRPEERKHDLTDILALIESYDANEDSRRFDLVDKRVEGRALNYDEAGAFLAGADIRALAASESLAVVRGFLSKIGDEYSKVVQHALLERPAHRRDDETRAIVFRMFRVFSAGIGQ